MAADPTRNARAHQAPPALGSRVRSRPARLPSSASDLMMGEVVGLMQVIRRVGLIGDLHAEDEALAFVIRELRKLGAETLLQVGDVADGPGDLERTIALMLEHQVLAVRGNHDRWLLGNQFRDLPHAKQLSATAPAVVDYLTALPV